MATCVTCVGICALTHWTKNNEKVKRALHVPEAWLDYLGSVVGGCVWMAPRGLGLYSR